MSELRVQFGRRLRQLRWQRDLTQEQFAEAAGISADMLSNIERGVNTSVKAGVKRWFESFTPACLIPGLRFLRGGLPHKFRGTLRTNWIAASRYDCNDVDEGACSFGT